MFWPEYDEYMRLKKWVDELQVTNDAAERAVKIAQETAEITRDPNHRDNILLVMNDNRGRVSSFRKRNLDKMNDNN